MNSLGMRQGEIPNKVNNRGKERWLQIKEDWKAGSERLYAEGALAEESFTEAGEDNIPDLVVGIAKVAFMDLQHEVKKGRHGNPDKVECEILNGLMVNAFPDIDLAWVCKEVRKMKDRCWKETKEVLPTSFAHLQVGRAKKKSHGRNRGN